LEPGYVSKGGGGNPLAYLHLEIEMKILFAEQYLSFSFTLMRLSQDYVMISCSVQQFVT
jgi:hypothetical protein